VPWRNSNRENCIMPALRHTLVATSLPKLFLQGVPTLQCKWWPGYINHHSPVDHEMSRDKRQWRREVCFHYESSLWTGYVKIRVTISPIQLHSTVSLPILVWLFLPSGRRQQYESPATVSLVQAKPGHKHTQGSMPWPHRSLERIGHSATSASASVPTTLLSQATTLSLTFNQTFMAL
jgi:hypothetical protein